MNCAYWDGTNATYLVDIREWKSERPADWSDWGKKIVKGFEKGRSLVPEEVRGPHSHIFTLKTGNRDEGNFVRVEADLS